MADIVAHCRVSALLHEGTGDGNLFNDAADLLTRLQADKARLEGERDQWKTAADALCAAGGIQGMAERYYKAEADLSALKQRVAEVLEPFAKEAERLGPSGSIYGTVTRPILTAGELRRAADLHATLAGDRT